MMDRNLSFFSVSLRGKHPEGAVDRKTKAETVDMFETSAKGRPTVVGEKESYIGRVVGSERKTVTDTWGETGKLLVFLGKVRERV